MHLRLKQCLAAFMLAVLLAAYAGQKVHIYLEDHAHFAAFSGDLVPDNGAAEQVVEFCVVDDFYFFPYLAETQPPHEFYAEVLAVLQPEATRCKCAVEVRRFSLRGASGGVIAFRNIGMSGCIATTAATGEGRRFIVCRAVKAEAACVFTP